MRALVLYSARAVRTIARGSSSREKTIIFIFCPANQRPRLGTAPTDTQRRRGTRLYIPRYARAPFTCNCFSN